MTMRTVGVGLLVAMAACKPIAKVQQGLEHVQQQAFDPAVWVAEGHATYQQSCQRCHGADGRGDGPDAKKTPPPASDLTLLAAQHGGTFPREYLTRVVTGDQEVAAHGPREMPVWRQQFGPLGSGAADVAAFTQQRRIETLADYLASIQRGSASSPASP